MTSHEQPSRWSAAASRPDMWLDPDEDPRATDGELRDERSTLLEYLQHFRMTMELKCTDLTAEQMALRSVPPSTMSLLGLLRHLAEVERNWFRRVMAGEDAPRLWGPPRADDDWNGAVADQGVVDQAWSAWRGEVAFAEEFVRRTTDLATLGHMSDGSTVQLREVLVHMIEEYARHCGHADLLRECIDGRVGQ